MNSALPISVSIKDQELILSILDEIPPSFLLPKLNERQTKNWKATKRQFKQLGKALKAYFSGESFPLKDELTDYGLELYGYLTDFYIKLYGVIQWGWDSITKLWIDNPFTNKNAYGEIFPCISPGETLAAILERDAASEFNQCRQGRFDFKPRKIYKTYLNQKKYNSGKLTSIQQQNHEKDVRNLFKYFESNSSLEYFCIIACHVGAEEKQDKVLKLRLKDYKTAKDNLSECLNRKFHKMKGHGWENGVFLETEKAGGTYKKTS